MARPRESARSALLVAILATFMLTLVAAPASAYRPEAERAIRVAKHQIGDPWVWGMRGPRAFDCSGLVYYAFRESHLLKRIGGEWRTVRGTWSWFARRGLASRYHPERGDLVIWGNAKHIGIYLGHGRAISTLTSGVRIHGVQAVIDPFTTYLHVRYRPSGWTRGVQAS